MDDGEILVSWKKRNFNDNNTYMGSFFFVFPCAHVEVMLLLMMINVLV
jgi:hypothetical protein